MSSKKRAWNDSCVKYGYTKVAKKGEVKAQCMEWGSILCNASLKPSKLNNHFRSVHDGKGTETDMIEKRGRFDRTGTLFGLEFTPPEKPILEHRMKLHAELEKQEHRLILEKL